MVEAELEAWLAPYVQGREAMRPVVINQGDGKGQDVKMVPDIPTRMKASEHVLDRVFGKPVQTTAEVGDPAADGMMSDMTPEQLRGLADQLRQKSEATAALDEAEEEPGSASGTQRRQSPPHEVRERKVPA